MGAMPSRRNAIAPMGRFYGNHRMPDLGAGAPTCVNPKSNNDKPPPLPFPRTHARW